VCDFVGADDLAFVLKQVGWDITNNGSDTATIVKIYLEKWPDDQYNQNYYLDRVEFSGSNIWNGWQWPAPANIQEGWLGDRTISGGGTSKTLQFNFRWTAVANKALYSITVTFDNGCEVSYAPMHISALGGSSYWSQGSVRWTANVAITVHDAGHNPVADAAVSGSWSGGYSGPASCTTDGAGQCSVVSGAIHENTGSVTFTVDVGGVTHETLFYCEESSVTSITVNKPPPP